MRPRPQLISQANAFGFENLVQAGFAGQFDPHAERLSDCGTQTIGEAGRQLRRLFRPSSSFRSLRLARASPAENVERPKVRIDCQIGADRDQTDTLRPGLANVPTLKIAGILDARVARTVDGFPLGERAPEPSSHIPSRSSPTASTEHTARGLRGLQAPCATVRC